MAEEEMNKKVEVFAPFKIQLLFDRTFIIFHFHRVMEKSKKYVELAARAQNVMTKYSDGTWRTPMKWANLCTCSFFSLNNYLLFGAIWTIKADGKGQGCCRWNVSISTLILQDSHSFALNRYLISNKKSQGCAAISTRREWNFPFEHSSCSRHLRRAVFEDFH